MNWIDIGHIDDIPERGARLVKTHAGCVAVFGPGTVIPEAALEVLDILGDATI